MTIRGERRKGEVLVTVDGAPLDWRSSLAVRNHSPTGPAWGYGGSGPAQLALAILLAVTDAATAERFYQRFKSGIGPVNPLPGSSALAKAGVAFVALKEKHPDVLLHVEIRIIQGRPNGTDESLKIARLRA